MEKVGITMGKFIAGIVIAILVSSAVSAIISTQLLVAGPEGPQGETGATGATGATGPEGPMGPQGPYLPDYDSGWRDITNEVGQFIDITHNLNSEDIIVDIRGKATAGGGAHQMHYGIMSNTQWTKTYGGTSDDYADALVQTADGGYALAGYTDSFGAGDFWLVKTDSAGNQLWTKTYGGTSYDYAYSVVQTADGGYALAGETASYGAGAADFWLVKTDEFGNHQWNKTYGGLGFDEAYSVVQTSDGYALAGTTDSYGAGFEDFWLVKTDEFGNYQWNKTYGGTAWDVAYSMVQTADGGYALAGFTRSLDTGNIDFWLVKTDSNGNHQWNKTYGGTSHEEAWSMVQTVDGGYALAGFTASLDTGNIDFWLVKTDSAGNHQWNKTYGGTSYDWALSVVQTSDGGYALAGETSSYGAGSADFWMVKTDSAGNHQWNKTYGGTSYDRAYSVVQTADGGYALAGYTESYGAGSADFWLVKTGVESGLAWTASTANTITLYRGATDIQWNYVQVRIWKID